MWPNVFNKTYIGLNSGHVDEALLQGRLEGEELALCAQRPECQGASCLRYQGLCHRVKAVVHRFQAAIVGPRRWRVSF